MDEPLIGRLTTAELVRDYMLAGHSTFTIKSVKTGKRFTFKMKKINTEDGSDRWLVLRLVGPDNLNGFSTIANFSIERGFWPTWAHRQFMRQTPYFIALDWLWRQINEKKLLPDSVEVWHEGVCACCGRKLTVPESIAAGFGPTCSANIAFRNREPELAL